MKTMGQMRDGGRPRRDIKGNEILPRSWMSPMINVRFLIPIFYPSLLFKCTAAINIQIIRFNVAILTQSIFIALIILDRR